MTRATDDAAPAIAVVDYGMGNLRSIENGFRVVGASVSVTDDPETLQQADGIVLPGVGAFSDGIGNLRDRGLVEPLEDAVLDRGTPYLGICLGMQFLARESDEHGGRLGLGWLPGVVKRIEPSDPSHTVPHMGWNDLAIRGEGVLYRGIDDGAAFYFAHSYHFEPGDVGTEFVTATTWHGTDVTASVRRDHIFGVQFHPEKSQGIGLRLLQNFTEHCGGSDG